MLQNITANPTEYGLFEYGGLPVEPDGGPARNGRRSVAAYTAVLVAVPDNSPLLGPVVAVQIWRIDGATDPGSQ